MDPALLHVFKDAVTLVLCTRLQIQPSATQQLQATYYIITWDSKATRVFADSVLLHTSTATIFGFGLVFVFLYLHLVTVSQL